MSGCFISILCLVLLCVLRCCVTAGLVENIQKHEGTTNKKTPKKKPLNLGVLGAPISILIFQT